MTSARAVVVSEARDQLALEIMRRLRARSVPTRWVTPGELSLVRVELEEEHLVVEEQPVSAIVWRVSPQTCFSDAFDVDDRGFCDAETGATWLAAMQLRDVLSINCFDATAWYAGLGWPIWRRLLASHGVSVVPLAIGECERSESWDWHPYTSLARLPVPEDVVQRVLGTAAAPRVRYQEILLVFGDALASGFVVPNVIAAAKVLMGAGQSLAAIEVDDRGAVASVDVLPTPRNGLLAETCERLAERIHAHWLAR